MGRWETFHGGLWPHEEQRLPGEGPAKRPAPCAVAGTLTYNVCSTYPLSALSSLCPLRVPVVFW